MTAENRFAYWYWCYHSVASAGLSACHVRALCSNGRRYWHDFFHIQQPHVCLRSC